MKKKYELKIKLRCITCGDSSFEYNDDKSWCKCERCGREYPGGYKELVELNQASINMGKDELANEVKKDLKEEISKKFKDALKGNKYIKFK